MILAALKSIIVSWLKKHHNTLLFIYNLYHVFFTREIPSGNFPLFQNIVLSVHDSSAENFTAHFKVRKDLQISQITASNTLSDF